MPPNHTHDWVAEFQSQSIGKGVIRLRPSDYICYIIITTYLILFRLLPICLLPTIRLFRLLSHRPHPLKVQSLLFPPLIGHP